MPYISCQYALETPDDIRAPGKKPITCIDDQGRTWFLGEDSQVGDYLEYIANGGTIEPYEAP